MTALKKLTSVPPDGILPLLNNPDWKPFQGDFQKIKSFLPNRIYHNKVTRTAAIIIGRALGGDFALSQLAFEFVIDALKAGKVAEANVALKERDGDEIIALKPILDVEASVSKSRPNDGIHGYYWWLDASFQIASRQAPRSQDGEWM